MLIGLPGIWVMLFAALLCELFLPELYDWPLLISALILAGLAELAEFLASAAGSSKAGGSRSGMVGSIVGGVAGLIAGTALIPIPLVGSVIGGVAGAGLGAMIAERGHAGRTWRESYASGQGAAIGRVVSIFVKGGFSLVIATLLVVGAWTP